MKTYMPSAKNIDRKWYIVDATGQTLGRLASQVASVLRGKNKPQFTPFMDMGDFVIIINADKVKLTGKKLDQKVYSTHTGQPGGLKETKYRLMMQTKPELVVKKAIRGNAAQEFFRQRHDQKAQGVRRRRAQSSGAETGSFRD